MAPGRGSKFLEIITFWLISEVRRLECTAGIFAARQREYGCGRLGLVRRFRHEGYGSRLIRRKEDSQMAIESHLAELERRHRALEQEISEALSHPSTDGLKIAELKRRKLYVKDEIARLRQDAIVH
jgi:hypothetical protein